MYECMYVCMYVCINVCIYERNRNSVHTHINIHTHHILQKTIICICMYMYVCMCLLSIHPGIAASVTAESTYGECSTAIGLIASHTVPPTYIHLYVYVCIL